MKTNTLEIGELRSKLADPKNKIPCWNCNAHNATDVHHKDANHKNNRPENLALWCKRCHNEYHGISDNLTELGLLVAEYEDVQKTRMAMGNRIGAYQRLGYNVETSQAIFEGLQKIENELDREVRNKIKGTPIYEEWLKQIVGIGHMRSAKLLSYIGSIDKFPTISSLWAYSGAAVVDGKAQKKKSGETANWHHKLKCLVVDQIPSGFIMSKGFGRQLYDRYKQFYTQRDGETLTKMHIERRTKRKVGKVFLGCLWLRWRELEGLPVTDPYPIAKLGHTSLIRPEEWAE
jgi:hypothetical protein